MVKHFIEELKKVAKTSAKRVKTQSTSPEVGKPGHEDTKGRGKRKSGNRYKKGRKAKARRVGTNDVTKEDDSAARDVIELDGSESEGENTFIEGSVDVAALPPPAE